MSLLSISSHTVATVAGFIAKQTFTYHCLSTVRLQLQELVGKVATNHFGKFVGILIGHEAGILLAIPVTSILADMVASAVKESVKAVIRLVNFFLFGIEEKCQTPLFREIVLQVASLATCIFAKSYFCNFCMPLVKIGIELSLKHTILLSIPLIPVGFAASSFAILLAPPITLLVGDIIGFIAGEATYQFLDRAISIF